MYRIEVSVKEGYSDPRAEGLEKDILDKYKGATVSLVTTMT